VRILLVEDRAADAEAAVRAALAAGAAHQVTWVKDGQEALDYLFCSGRHAGRDPGEPPTLVLLHLRVPRIDGIEILRRMKGSQHRSIPVVVMTSSSEERDVLESYRLGVAAYVGRPLAPEAFRAALSSLGLE
jgi:CheY-like chemotaxis protein